MDQLDQYKEKLTDNFNILQDLVNKSPLFHTDKQKWQNQVQKKMNAVKKDILIFKDQATQHAQISHYMNNAKSFEMRLKKLQNDYAHRGRKNSVEDDKQDQKEDQNMSPLYQVFKRGDQAQDMTKASIKEMNIMVQRGIQMAADINLELNKQIQQLDRMKDRTKDAQTTLKRAQKNIVYFVRALQCDLCMVGLLLLILLALVGVIVLAVKNANK